MVVVMLKDSLKNGSDVPCLTPVFFTVRTLLPFEKVTFTYVSRGGRGERDKVRE